MKKQLTINTLTLLYKNIKLFSFYTLRVYNFSESNLRLHDMFVYPSWLVALRLGEWGSLYDDSDLCLVNDFELPNLSRFWMRVIKSFLQLDQNIRRYPHNLDVEYNIEKLPLIPHQLRCFTSLSCLKLNLIGPSFLKGRSLKDIDQGIILKNLKNNSLLNNFDFTDTVIEGCKKMSLELIFMALQRVHFLVNKNWKNWLEFAKKNTLWYDDFLSVERSNLLGDLAYKFDYIPIDGFREWDDFYFFDSHSFGINSFFPPSQNWINEDSYMDVYRIVEDLRGEGLRKKFNPLRELDLIDMHFDLIISKNLSERIRIWQKLLENKK